MDRSYLSEPKLIALSRKFVCARLATYEDAEEGEFLRSLFETRSGELENTLFALLAPDGKTLLSRAGRSPRRVFRGPYETSLAGLLSKLEEIGSRYRLENASSPPRVLPYHPTARRALNVAACDLRPVVLVTETNKARRADLEKALAKLVWTEPFLGQFEFASGSRAELSPLVELGRGQALVVAQPDSYGLKGKVLSSSNQTRSEALEKVLHDGLRKFEATGKDSRQHVIEGRRHGLFWNSKIPATDPGPQRRR